MFPSFSQLVGKLSLCSAPTSYDTTVPRTATPLAHPWFWPWYTQSLSNKCTGFKSYIPPGSSITALPKLCDHDTFFNSLNVELWRNERFYICLTSPLHLSGAQGVWILFYLQTASLQWKPQPLNCRKIICMSADTTWLLPELLACSDDS